MKCPVCVGENLVMSDRQGVEIDYCPKCRGVWLDRGELDKIIERSTTATAPVQSSVRYREEARSPSSSDGRYREESRSSSSDVYKKKKKGSFLDDLFDF